MRPKKTRWVKCLPGERCFKPVCKPFNKVKCTSLTLDEFEAVRLADLDGLEHLDAAKRLKISRPTFSRILSSARNKIADGLVNIKAIKIEGGCCKILSGKKR
ncbi:MAG: DUF134 domain-containing protein [Candidatus Omnitrophota bacterium]|nr:DUF134 domain-containing protein [Candidatus Omnitrophota bacterium]